MFILDRVEGVATCSTRAPKLISPAYWGPGASGSIRVRTVERMPSAPISTSAVASEPSAKCAVTPSAVSVASTSRRPCSIRMPRRSASPWSEL